MSKFSMLKNVIDQDRNITYVDLKLIDRVLFVFFFRKSCSGLCHSSDMVKSCKYIYYLSTVCSIFWFTMSITRSIRWSTFAIEQAKTSYTVFTGQNLSRPKSNQTSCTRTKTCIEYLLSSTNRLRFVLFHWTHLHI